MPLQNRVDPWGEIHAVPAKGNWMGNRGGCFHDDEKRLTRRRWASKHWIICALNFKNRKRAMMQPKHYTELFFLDEATALAAGHRPCFECRRDAAQRFRQLWPHPDRTSPGIDTVLHLERLVEKKVVPIGGLPDGAMVEHMGSDWLKRDGHLHRWSFGGYQDRLELPKSARLLTPPSTVAVLAAGYLKEL